MAEDDVMNGMKRAGRALVTTGLALAALASQTACTIHYHKSTDQTAGGSTSAPVVVPQGTPTATSGGALMTRDGYAVRYDPVPATNLTMATLIRGNEVKVCLPNDEVTTINKKPNATISINADKTVCFGINRDNSAYSYNPVTVAVGDYDLVNRLNYGATLWNVAEQGATRYVVNAYAQQRADQYGFPQRLPTAITQTGQIVVGGFPLKVARGNGLTRVDLKAFQFVRGADGRPEGRIVPLANPQDAPAVPSRQGGSMPPGGGFWAPTPFN